MSNLIEKLNALVSHVETADTQSTSVNVVHLARELVGVVAMFGELLHAVGVIEDKSQFTHVDGGEKIQEAG
jgi:uncharacterized membrane protein YecN with MAPEG domain